MPPLAQVNTLLDGKGTDAAWNSCFDSSKVLSWCPTHRNRFNYSSFKKKQTNKQKKKKKKKKKR